jgi:hypothetical protein
MPLGIPLRRVRRRVGWTGDPDPCDAFRGPGDPRRGRPRLPRARAPVRRGRRPAARRRRRPGRALGAADRHPRREPVGGGHDRIARARAVRAARGERPFDTALDVASISAALFTVASGFTAFFTFVNIFNATPNAAPSSAASWGASSCRPTRARLGADHPCRSRADGAHLRRPRMDLDLVRGRAGDRQPRADGDAGPLRRRRRPQHRRLRTRCTSSPPPPGSAACCC